MPSRSRRRVLASLAGAAVLAGCTTGDPPRTGAGTDTDTTGRNPTASPSPTSAESTTQTPSESTARSTPVSLSAADLGFDVTIARQPDDRVPGRIRASLTNLTGRSVALSGGDPLPVGFDTIDTERVDASTPLMLFPQQADATNEYMNADTGEPLTIEDAAHDECWRMPARIVHTAAAMALELSPDADVVADYFPLGYPDAGCPAGTYEAHGDMSVQSLVDGEPIGRIQTTMRVKVTQEGTLSVDSSMRVESR